MAQNVTLYNLLISCPGDIKEEVTLIEAAVDEFNELYTETLGITIKTRHWSKSSYAQSGGKPQALLNEQFVNATVIELLERDAKRLLGEFHEVNLGHVFSCDGLFHVCNS